MVDKLELSHCLVLERREEWVCTWFDLLDDIHIFHRGVRTISVAPLSHGTAFHIGALHTDHVKSTTIWTARTK